MKNSLMNEFNIHIDNNIDHQKDYNIFKNKDELDLLRKNILEKLGDLTYANGEITKDIILKCMNEETLSSNLSNLERSNLYNIIDNEINGYGPLSELLNDSKVDEIMVNGPSDIFVSIEGNIIKDDSVSFINDAHIIRTIKKMIKDSNINIDEEKVFTTSLKDGSIVNVVLPPVSAKGPVLTIKKTDNFISDIDELLKLGILTPFMARFLASSIEAGLNILVCGSSLSGKTSILNALANFIPDDKRIITIENIGELKINKENIVTINNDIDEKLLNVGLKMHADTMVVGEIKKDIVYPTLDIMINKATNVLTTFNATGAIDAINKIENIGISSYNYSSKKIRDIMYNGIDLIIVIEKLNDKKHRITSICEFNKNQANEIVLKEIFAYKNNEYVLYNYQPRAYNKIKAKGINDLDDIF